MSKDTIEGEQLIREIGPLVFKKSNKKNIPLMNNLIRTILNNKILKI
jgi:hypothetical protein